MSRRIRVEPVENKAAFWDDRSVVLECLRERPPRIPAWYGYDEVGSRLWEEELSTLPNYYLRPAEFALLQQHAGEIAGRLGPRVAELGSGSAKKTQLLLSPLSQRRPTTYLPIDVSREMLEHSAKGLVAELEGVEVHGLWGRYEAGLSYLRLAQAGPLTVLWLGSAIGNTTSAERAALVGDIANTLKSGDFFFVTADLVKPGPVLEAAYNDPPGATAQARFRLNQLAYFSRCFEGNVVLHRFYPRAHYVAETMTVEGHLYATEDQTITLRALDYTLTLRRGESICHGHSVKFHRPEFVDAVCDFGFELDTEWIDAVWQYGLFLFVRR